MHAWSAPTVPTIPGTPPPLRVHDTAAQAVVEASPERAASLYVCGITPYDATHLGHANTYVAFDLLQRQWLDAGLDVTYVQNVTDVDDPLLERATATGVDWRDLAASQVELFRNDMLALRVLPPQHYVGAVESVEWIVDGVEELASRGLAYTVPGGEGEPDGDVYFDVAASESALWQLGSESHYDEATMLTLSAQRGGDPDRAGKRGRLDPLLWRVERQGEPAWEGRSLGAGRPGWHIECSLIAVHTVPGTLTVQGGGSDLIFPHHEFSAGHTAALADRELAQHYVHTGMVGLDGEKMSKSLGNLVLVSKLLAAGVDPRAIRVVLLGQHYRSDWFYEETLLTAAQERLAAWTARLPFTTLTRAQALVSALRSAMAQDLDSPAALAALDAWAAETAEQVTEPLPDGAGSALARDAVDALLGIRLD
ncbi:cysteine--1-D-myo-inosityl 2-amino-2-deoxy-alpha-D-glucopyranoside ligase [Galactobacter caseinivorans]|uniref:L-cysteine:1D-myo-inositol 2-amino-2-deoxy-alpha-D-glucopyranoside ligase n=1 Tax=Galactobacter caseinivorans TaxID=2676123 RepID=A0A496PKS5_9MICC|nr:cysteine--1-D-myo-inosityl 2-amino-2-deoxy-alpha-D-glucopyranoside ligase [Galactobacter caseinivorans]RKW71104.1 cysteine--1-D-myo-inosityl 2-amino-2-deoxy-alpha-D-glucopyranoside ligase [Galactobacter caseinivorans]